MKNLILTLSGLSVAVLLAACGGGGASSSVDDSAAVAATAAAATPAGVDATRYAGSWGSCSSTGNGASETEAFVITATSTDSFAFNDTTTSYASADCSGAAGAITGSTSGTFVFSGTKILGTDTVDEGILTQGTNAPQKQILLATATTIRTGRMVQDGGTLDADGYPNTLDTNRLVRL
jgi:hypothetical protein